MKHISVLLGFMATAAGLMLFYFEPLIDWRINRLSHSVVEDISVNDSRRSDLVASETHYDFEAVDELSVTSMLSLPDETQLQAIGTLEMPEVDMTIPLLDGLSEWNLMAGAGTMKENQEPGVGNYAIAGHNWRDRTTLFSPLHRAEEGMSIFLTVNGERYEYVVSMIQMVEPSRIDVIEDKDEPLLTLITCNHDGTERLIVQASLV